MILILDWEWWEEWRYKRKLKQNEKHENRLPVKSEENDMRQCVGEGENQLLHNPLESEE